MRANRHARQEIGSCVKRVGHGGSGLGLIHSAVDCETMRMSAVVRVRQVVGLVRGCAIGNCGRTVVARIDNLRADCITVVNVRQEALDRCDEHAGERDELADAADQRAERL